MEYDSTNCGIDDVDMTPRITKYDVAYAAVKYGAFALPVTGVKDAFALDEELFPKDTADLGSVYFSLSIALLIILTMLTAIFIAKRGKGKYDFPDLYGAFLIFIGIFGTYSDSETYFFFFDLM